MNQTTIWNEYLTILADPPWAERGGGKIKRGADRHYPLMKTPVILEVIQYADCWRPARDAHLWMWVTNNHLEGGLWVMKKLGFRYITNWPWFKGDEEDFASGSAPIGLGQYQRGQHELLLFGVRGRAMVPPTHLRHGSVIFERKREHSKKPEKSYRIIEDTSRAPRLEMFAREPRDGWDVWGNEV